jgi:hypothetical protein
LKETEGNRQRGMDIGKETEGNRHRESDRGEHAREEREEIGLF